MTEPNNYHEIIKFLYDEYEYLKLGGNYTNHLKELVKIGWVENLKTSGELSKTSCELLEDILIK